ncbi:peptide chain release factor N(5)-glutamine methyltransferase [Nakamurella leprariae]|uniref:Release factor glutamine methyltransferase n=1 Tax=Nakamurella leprariae TaxID=2803911 RepID=A0A938YC35_9ACTN|nr:peptide chain release factor N(5)-glutamine methyltransferase [Nakamurella leprariae]MBM9465757.1 peptide chain release factor N(5)-glutamine methyltransferase [Nakamurella leprariae]
MTGAERSGSSAAGPVTLRAELSAAERLLAAAGVASPVADARWLAAHVLGVDRGRLGLHPLLTGDQRDSFRDLVTRRAARQPLQHLLGTAVLGPVEVAVGPGVFVPRPETESMVEWAVQAIASVAAPLVVDLCAGTGAIALAVSRARPDAQVVAVERSVAALPWARRNVGTHRAAGGGQVELRAGDVLDERVLADLDGRADLVISNPPYVPDGTRVDPEVADWDPPEAVFAGPDGLSVILPLIPVAAALLRVGGVLAIEHDDSHGEVVPELIGRRRLFAEVQDHPDLTGRPRFVTARRVPLAGPSSVNTQESR